MKLQRKEELLAKGWQEKEIKKAEETLERANQQDVFFSKIVFWSALVVIVFANLLVSVILIPFLIAFDRLFLYSIIIVLAGTVGFLYNFLITDIGHLERKHHIMAGIIVPLLALANMIGMVIISNRFVDRLQVPIEHHNPWLTAATFALAFILPYLLDRLRLSIQERRG